MKKGLLVLFLALALLFTACGDEGNQDYSETITPYAEVTRTAGQTIHPFVLLDDVVDPEVDNSDEVAINYLVSDHQEVDRIYDFTERYLVSVFTYQYETYDAAEKMAYFNDRYYDEYKQYNHAEREKEYIQENQMTREIIDFEIDEIKMDEDHQYARISGKFNSLYHENESGLRETDLVYTTSFVLWVEKNNDIWLVDNEHYDAERPKQD